MKILAISDTHGQHAQVVLPAADVLIHAGDVSTRGKEDEVLAFLAWFTEQPHPHKILIAGNHDFYFERNSPAQIAQILPENIIYLQDSGVEIEGIKFWGSPITPFFYNWAFNRFRGPFIRRHWHRIPADTDVLITHGPLYGVLDANIYGEPCGCKDLLKRVEEINPKVHICGHIHEGYGQQYHSETLCINASLLNEKYQLLNESVVFEI